MYEVDGCNLLNSKIDMLTKKLEATTKMSNPKAVYFCELCGGGNSTIECQRGLTSQD